LKRNKYGKSGKGSSRSGGKKSYGGESGDSVISSDELIDWKVAKLSLIEEIQKKQKPIVLFFMDEEMDAIEASREIHDATLARMAKDGEAFFLLIEHNPDRTPSLSDGSPVPTGKLTSTNPAREYGVSSYPTVLVCDWHGNEYKRIASTPSPDELRKRINEVSPLMSASEQKLRKNLDAAKASLEKKELRKFFSLVLNNFKGGVVGLDAQNEGIQLYRELLDKTREEIDEILAEKPKDGLSRLKAMSKDFRDTELRKDIDDAMEILKG
jgi:hypothetical protein